MLVFLFLLLSLIVPCAGNLDGIFFSISPTPTPAKIVQCDDEIIITDKRDNKTYKTVTIGDQTWMAENLSYNIDTSWCFNNDKNNCEKYGRLYNWNTATRACPDEWRLPSRLDWEILKRTIGTGKDLKTTTGWDSGNNGTDEFCFSALPGGKYTEGGFYGIGWTTGWWSYEHGAKDAYYWDIGEDNWKAPSRSERGKEAGFYVRCIWNHSPKQYPGKNTTPFTNGIMNDKRDSKTYKTITIGKKIWMDENLNYRTGNSRCSNNEELSCEKYGRLYDLETASRACPNEWHLPDNKEWQTMEKTLGNRNEWGDGRPIRCVWNHGANPDLRGYFRNYINDPIGFIQKGQKPKNNDMGKLATVNDLSIIDPRDGQKYRVTKIGGLKWMAENLSYKAKGSLCYKGNELNCQKYGRLYDWNAAIKACPGGWRLPSSEDWDDLAKAAGGKIASKKLKSKTEWNGTDEFGFSALPGGSKGNQYENFHDMGLYGRWWTSTSDGADGSSFDFASGKGIGTSGNEIFEFGNGKTFYHSVRCIQD